MAGDNFYVRANATLLNEYSFLKWTYGNLKEQTDPPLKMAYLILLSILKALALIKSILPTDFNLLVRVCTSLSTMAEAYSNCPRVSFVSAPSPTRTCSGSLLRVSRGNNTFPDPPNAGGKRYFSSRTSKYTSSLHVCVHFPLKHPL